MEHSVVTRDSLVISIVDKKCSEKIVTLTKRAGARGGTIAYGRGSSDNSLAEFFGIGDSEQAIILTLADDANIGPIMAALRAHEEQGKRRHGIAIRIDVEKRSLAMNATDHVLMTFIVNKGYADDAMFAAHKAGASGGTILHGLGTGTEEDVKFFGISLVPEKEILFVVVERAKSDAVLAAVQQVPCLAEPGAGIAFSIAVEEFIPLGKKLD